MADMGVSMVYWVIHWPPNSEVCGSNLRFYMGKMVVHINFETEFDVNLY